MANITLAEVGNSLATIIAAQALGYLKQNTVFARLVNRDYEAEIAQRGETVRVPVAGALVVNDKGQNLPVTLQNPNDDGVDVVLNKHKEVSFLLEDVARALATPDYLNRYMQDGLALIAEQIDGDIAALWAGVTESLPAVTLERGEFLDARRILNGTRTPLRNRHAVLHQDAESQLLALGEFTNRDYAELRGGGNAAQTLVEAYSGRFMGFDVYMDQGIAVAAGKVKNLFFHRDAFALVTRPLPLVPDGMGAVQRTMAEDGVGIRVTMSYSPAHLGVQTTLDILYGVAVLRADHAVVVETDAIV